MQYRTKRFYQPIPLRSIRAGGCGNRIEGAINFDFRIHPETCHLTACANGPDFGPSDGVFGGGFINTFIVPINFAQPQQGRPTLYEMNMVVDILGPGWADAFCPGSSS
jgi:hypothetical protein